MAFVFLGPLTKVPPAYAGSGARQRGEPEYKHNERREKQAAAYTDICFSQAINERIACVMILSTYICQTAVLRSALLPYRRFQIPPPGL